MALIKYKYTGQGPYHLYFQGRKALLWTGDVFEMEDVCEPANCELYDGEEKAKITLTYRDHTGRLRPSITNVPVDPVPSLFISKQAPAPVTSTDVQTLGSPEPVVAAAEVPVVKRKDTASEVKALRKSELVTWLHEQSEDASAEFTTKLEAANESMHKRELSELVDDYFAVSV